MLRRVQVQADHVGSLGLEVRIVGRQIAFQAVRFDRMLGPDARDRHVRDRSAQLGGKLSRRPVCRAVGGLSLGRPRQHARLDTIGHLVRLAPGVACKQARQAVGRKPLAPAIDVAVAAIELGANLGPRQPLAQQQDQTSMSRRIRPTVPRIGLSLQFHEFRLAQFHRALHRRNDTSHLNVTVH